jgi:hypothetical protein
MDINDTVVLKRDIPDENLQRGAVGVIVTIFDVPGEAYEVEFTDATGRLVADIALRRDDIEIVSRG